VDGPKPAALGYTASARLVTLKSRIAICDATIVKPTRASLSDAMPCIAFIPSVLALREPIVSRIALRN